MKEAWTEKEVKVLKEYYPIIGGRTQIRRGKNEIKENEVKRETGKRISN